MNLNATADVLDLRELSVKKQSPLVKKPESEKRDCLPELTNNELLLATKRSVEHEREAMIAVLEHLNEIKKRKVHLELGYSSLHEFCVNELKYSDGAAYRRISALHLIGELPQAKGALENGVLSLSNAATLQTHFKKSQMQINAKEALLTAVQGKSKRECEKILFAAAQARGSEGHHGLAVNTLTKLEFLADQALTQDLKRLSELLAIPQTDLSALIKRIARIALQAIDPVLKKTRKPVTSSAEDHVANPATDVIPQEPIKASPVKLRYIPAYLKKQIWIRDQSQCAYTHPESKRRCTSRFRLEIDHIKPVAHGGRSTLENLRLLCFHHNQYAAEEILGKAVMERHRIKTKP
ncbi:MAG: HNH endonuclease [Bdellovibrionota bacterium]